jgi:hypothetical protein
MEASVLCFLELGYDKWYQSIVDCRTPAQLEQSLLRTSIFPIICQNYHLTLISWFYKNFMVSYSSLSKC